MKENDPTVTRLTLAGTAPEEFGASSKRFRSAINTIKFSKDGNYCALGTTSKLLCLFNPYRGRMLQKFQAHGLDVVSVDCSSDNGNLISGSKDMSCIFWDVETAKTLRRFREHRAPVTRVLFPGVTSTVCITGSLDTCVRIFDTESRNQNKPVQEMNHATDAITGLASKRHYIASGSADGIVRVYDIRKGQLASVDLASGTISSLALSHDCESVLVNFHGDDGTGNKYNLHDGISKTGSIKLVDLLTINSSEPTVLQSVSDMHKNMQFQQDCCFNGKQEDHILAGSDDGHVFRWSILQPKTSFQKIKLGDGDNPITSVCNHPVQPGKFLATGPDAFYLVEDDVDENMLLDADIRTESTTTNKKRCLEREYLPGAYL